MALGFTKQNLNKISFQTVFLQHTKYTAEVGVEQWGAVAGIIGTACKDLGLTLTVQDLKG